MKKLLTALILLAWCGSAWGATYYVDGALGTDDPAYGGSSGAGAYQTMMYAESQVGDGNTIYVAAGTYDETHIFEDDIIWIASGAVTLTSPHDTACCIVQNLTSSMTLRGFLLDREESDDAGDQGYALQNASAGTVILDNTWVDDADSDGVGLYYFYCSLAGGTIKVINTTGSINGTNAAHNTICFNLADNTTVDIDGEDPASPGNTITLGTTGLNQLYDTGGTGSVMIVQDSNLIANSPRSSGNISLRHGTLTITGNTITTTDSSVASLIDALPEDCTFTFSSNTVTISAKTSQHYIYIDNGTIDTTISSNSFIMSDDADSATKNFIFIINQTEPITISGNTFTEPSVKNQAMDFIEVTSLTPGGGGGQVTITDNILEVKSYADTHGIIVGTEATSAGDNFHDGAIITGNTVYGPSYFDNSLSTADGTHAIFVGYNIDAVIERNTVIGSGYGILLKAGDGAVMAYTTGGIKWNKITGTIPWYAIVAKGIEDVPIQNNSIYIDGNTGAASAPQFIRCSHNNADPSHGAIIQNNACYTSGSEAETGIYVISNQDTEALALAEFTIDHNVINGQSTNYAVCVYDADADDDIDSDAGDTTQGFTLAQWQTAGMGTGSYDTIPSFAGVASNDLNICGGVCVNGGTDVYSGVDQTDLSGNTVDVSARVPIGGYDYDGRCQGSTSTATGTGL